MELAGASEVIHKDLCNLHLPVGPALVFKCSFIVSHGCRSLESDIAHSSNHLHFIHVPGCYHGLGVVNSA